jgi:hypothetical protein
MRWWVIVWVALGVAGCSRSPHPGNHQPGSTARNQKAQNPPNANGQHPAPATQSKAPFSEPAQSVTMQPSAASDNGTPAAVAHRSIAEPGAPEGTLQGRNRPGSGQAAGSGVHPQR